MNTLLQGQTLVSEVERGVQHSLEIKRGLGGKCHVQSRPYILVTA